MDTTQVAAELEQAKKEFEAKATDLRRRIEHARRAIERYETKLSRLYHAYDLRAHAVSRHYMQIPQEPAAESADRAGTARTRRWSLDGPMLELIRTMPAPVVAVPDVWSKWNQGHCDGQISRTTVRGVLERLVRDGELKVIEVGRPGRNRVRLYKLASVNDPEHHEEEQTI